MGDLFNTLNKSLPGRCHWKDNSCVVHCLYSQLRCIRAFRKIYSCLRRSDRRESDGMGHVFRMSCQHLWTFVSFIVVYMYWFTSDYRFYHWRLQEFFGPRQRSWKRARLLQSGSMATWKITADMKHTSHMHIACPTIWYYSYVGIAIMIYGVFGSTANHRILQQTVGGSSVRFDKVINFRAA